MAEEKETNQQPEEAVEEKQTNQKGGEHARKSQKGKKGKKGQSKKGKKGSKEKKGVLSASLEKKVEEIVKTGVLTGNELKYVEKWLNQAKKFQSKEAIEILEDLVEKHHEE